MPFAQPFLKKVLEIIPQRVMWFTSTTPSASQAQRQSWHQPPQATVATAVPMWPPLIRDSAYHADGSWFYRVWQRSWSCASPYSHKLHTLWSASTKAWPKQDHREITFQV